jgi:antirestriction protein
MNTTTMSTCRIYVASLSDYNNGHLLGRWIDCDQSADEIQAEINEMLRESKFPNVKVECPHCDGSGDDNGCPTCLGSGLVPSAEEWAIHDHEFCGIKLGEHEDIEWLAALAAAIEEHGDAFVCYVKWQGTSNCDDIDSAVSDFQDKYQGEHDSLADYVEQYWEDTGEYKRNDKQWWSPINYVDWERMARDLELGGDVHTEDSDGGKIHVFNNN